MITINARIDENLKAQAEKVLDSLGLTMSAAVTVFLKQVVKQQKIPFELVTSTEHMVQEEAVAYQVSHPVDLSFEQTPEFKAYLQKRYEDSFDDSKLVSSDNVLAEARKMIEEKFK
ncbi:MAG: type II toxin-antitoxin system RelB/DinJ family antitoxin [Streptococcaceae bacterium]|jgi:DNA-damage-inducible protein J|nr:type II toxin-antitoxin system RelB/DinJ family antitoxin [Streptococcaceae bacterium]